MKNCNDRQEIYCADELVIQRSGQRAVAEKVPYGEEVLNRYFDGYPELIKGEEMQPKYTLKLEKDVKVPMRDGVQLYTDIYRPDVEGEKFPALLAYAYWEKDVNESFAWMAEHPQAYLDTPFWDGSLEACNFNYTVPRGFAHVIPDPRGRLRHGGMDRGPALVQRQGRHDRSLCLFRDADSQRTAQAAPSGGAAG